jgi:hypothetical protein
MQLKYNDFYDNGFIQLENKWFKIIDGENLIKKVSIEGFYLLVNLLTKRTYGNTVCFNRQLISNYFGGARSERANIGYQALNKLVGNDVLLLKQEIDFNKPKAEDFIEAEVNFPVSFKKDYFTVFKDHIDIIMDYKGKENKSKLLSLFYAIRYRIYENQACYISTNTIINEINIDKKTVKKYIGILQDIGLILYDNPNMRRFVDNTVKESPNFYILQAEGADKILSNHINEYKKIQINKGVSFIGGGEIK